MCLYRTVNLFQFIEIDLAWQWTVHLSSVIDGIRSRSAEHVAILRAVLKLTVRLSHKYLSFVPIKSESCRNLSQKNRLLRIPSLCELLQLLHASLEYLSYLLLTSCVVYTLGYLWVGILYFKITRDLYGDWNTKWLIPRKQILSLTTLSWMEYEI
jgi:hypothetical protein